MTIPIMKILFDDQQRQLVKFVEVSEKGLLKREK